MYIMVWHRLIYTFHAGLPQWHYITVTSQWAWWRLKSPASPLFTQLFIQAQIKNQNSASLAFVGNPRREPVTLKMFPFDDVIMVNRKIVIIPMKYIGWVHRSHGSTKSYVIAKIKKHNVTVSRVHPVPGLLFRYAFLFWRKLTAF